jgi:putative membrane protein
MIVRDRPSGLRLFFTLRGSVLKRIQPVLLFNIAFAILITAVHGSLFDRKITLTAIPFTLMGLPLAIFLGFRNNAAYDRYWEGRRLWGGLVADAQILCRQCLSLFKGEDPAAKRLGLEDARVRMIYRAIAYAHALRIRLRQLKTHDELRPFLSGQEWQRLSTHSNPPAFLMHQMGVDLRFCLHHGLIEPCLATSVDATFSSMMGRAIACDRIKTTPIPFSYTLLLHRTAYLYCFLLPFGLVDTVGFMTPFVVAIVAYTFFGLDALGDEIEEPFGMCENDLPLDALCRTIEINLREAIGDPTIPAPLLPVDYCLM